MIEIIVIFVSSLIVLLCVLRFSNKKFPHYPECFDCNHYKTSVCKTCPQIIKGE